MTRFLRFLRAMRARSFNDINPMLLGAISLAAVGALIAAVFAVGNFGVLHHRYQMSGVFTDSSGLRNGDVVRVAGVDVGEVTGIDADFGAGQVVVTWEVDNGVHLGPQTTAEIAVATLLGGMYLKLGGPVSTPFMQDVPRSQRRIPLERTKTPATVTDVLNNATRAVEQIDVADVNKLLDQLGDLTADNGGDIGAIASSLNTVATAINDRKAQIEQLLTNTQQITATLASRNTQLATLVDNASKLLDVLAQRRDALAQLLGSGASVVTTLSNVITEHRAQLQAILDDLHATLAVTDANLPQLDQTLAFVGPTFAGVAATTHHGPWLDAVADNLPGLDLLNLIKSLGGAP